MSLRSRSRWGEPGWRHVIAPSDAWVSVVAAVILLAMALRGVL